MQLWRINAKVPAEKDRFATEYLTWGKSCSLLIQGSKDCQISYVFFIVCEKKKTAQILRQAKWQANLHWTSFSLQQPGLNVRPPILFIQVKTFVYNDKLALYQGSFRRELQLRYRRKSILGPKTFTCLCIGLPLDRLPYQWKLMFCFETRVRFSSGVTHYKRFWELFLRFHGYFMFPRTVQVPTDILTSPPLVHDRMFENPLLLIVQSKEGSWITSWKKKEKGKTICPSFRVN